MGKFYESINDEHIKFIQQQHLFFVSTAPLHSDGHINVSPKGLDSFRVLSHTQVAYMDMIGSGNETAAHLLENGRITIMFCSFEKKPLILRLYGKGKAIQRTDAGWNNLAEKFTIYESTRQIMLIEIFMVQTSCGYGIPYYEYKEERDIHFQWAEHKGAEGLKQYIIEKNGKSIDSLPTPTIR